MTEPGQRPAEEPAAPADADGERPFADLDERPVAEHVAAYEAVHRTLQDTLAAVDGS